MIRIVVADSHAFVREGLQQLIDARRNMSVVGVAADGAEALELIRQLQPDVLVVDITLPKISGSEVVRRTQEISSGTRIIAVSDYDDDEYSVAAMAAGATTFLPKAVAGSELVDAVERITGGGSVAHPPTARRVTHLWARRWVGEEEPAGGLTSRELDVVSLAARGLRSGAIAEELGISVRTVETHCRNVFRKLHVSSRVEAVLFAVSHDLVAGAAEVVGQGRRRVVPDAPRRQVKGLNGEARGTKPQEAGAGRAGAGRRPR